MDGTKTPQLPAYLLSQTLVPVKTVGTFEVVPQVCWGGPAVVVTVERMVVLNVTTSVSV